ncbi:hypothetical protein SELMODRAFT_38741, partial [Selaginella moellendorffii]
AAVLPVVLVLGMILHVAMAAQGTATYYDSPYTPNACADNNLPADHMFAAGSAAIYMGGRGCGDMYTVKCVRQNNQGPYGCTSNPGPYTIKIVDYCPEGCNGTFDLPHELFQKMADPNAGNIIVEYQKI